MTIKAIFVVLGFFYLQISSFLLKSQLSSVQTCSREELQNKWKGLCLPAEQLETLLSLGRFGTEIDWMEFFALGCGALGAVRCSIWSDRNPK